MIFLIINRTTQQIVDSFDVGIIKEPSLIDAEKYLEQNLSICNPEYMCNGAFMSYFYDIKFINPKKITL